MTAVTIAPIDAERSDQKRMAKLPRWAQDDLVLLTRNLADARARIAALVGETETNIEVDPYRVHTSGENRRMFLADGTTIRFHVDGGRVDVRLRKGAVYINSSTRGDGEMMVVPNASNTIEIVFATVVKAEGR